MNERELFEQGCFLPEWAVDDNEVLISEVYTRQNKDLHTLLSELDDIKNRIQEIQAKQWRLAQMIHFHENHFARE